ncbi:MAG: pyridoxamine 5'-phosphate oxidase family protein [Thermodesulfobacteriota bacterium]
MSDDIKDKIASYLERHKYMALATVGPDSTPSVRTVSCTSEGTTIYFATFKGTRKAREIEANPNVACAVYEQYEDLMKIQGVTLKGRAAMITDEAEARRVGELMAKKFPEFAKIGPNPDVRIFKVEPVSAGFIDFTKGFNHRDDVSF